MPSTCALLGSDYVFSIVKDYVLSRTHDHTVSNDREMLRNCNSTYSKASSQSVVSMFVDIAKELKFYTAADCAIEPVHRGMCDRVAVRHIKFKASPLRLTVDLLTELSFVVSYSVVCTAG